MMPIQPGYYRGRGPIPWAAPDYEPQWVICRVWESHDGLIASWYGADREVGLAVDCMKGWEWSERIGAEPDGAESLPATMPHTRGEMYSDRCQFCQGFGKKAKPYICKDCWAAALKAVVDYGSTPMPCGHPPECFSSADEGKGFCRWCEDRKYYADCDRDEILSALVGMVKRHCSPWGDRRPLHFRGEETNAVAMRLLDRLGIIDLSDKDGDILKGVWVKGTSDVERRCLCARKAEEGGP